MPKDGELILDRSRELARRKDGKLYGELIKTFERVRRGFEDQQDRADDILDYWDIYNCVLNNYQYYNGTSDIYVPAVRNAVTALVTRYLNQIFPASGRYIDATSSDGEVPHAIVSLLEHYIRNTHFRIETVAPLLRNGQIEGQYNLYVDWERTERHSVSRETSQPKIQLPGMPMPAEGLGDASGGEITDMRPDVIIDSGPAFDVLHDTDVLVMPATAKSVEDALRQGGSVTIIRRWTKETLEGMVERGEIVSAQGKQLLELAQDSGSGGQSRVTEKQLIDAAGIRAKGKVFQVYETWQILDTEEGRRLCRSYYGGYEIVLGCRRNPFWSDRCPLLSVPLEKVSGSFKGRSPIAAGVDSLQYHINQIAQQAADSTTYSMLPIIMTDPAKNPRTSSMILNCAAIWEVDPNSTRFAEFPKLWQDGIALIQADMQMIFQTLNVNPAMLPQRTGSRKPNQAEIAAEQAVDLLSVGVAVSGIEEGILTPAMERTVENDHQFRDDALTVRAFGEAGHVAQLESIPMIQATNRYHFTWFGVEQARNAQQIQQQIAWLNVAMSPPMLAALKEAGYMVNPAPALEHSAGNAFGWRMGRQILIDKRSQMTVDAMLENKMMGDGFDVPVHPGDNDPEHLQAHLQDMQAAGDPSGNKRLHIQSHMASMQKKAAAQQMATQAPGARAGPPPGAAEPGAQPQMPRPMRGPPGAIHPDQMPRAGAIPFPRKF